MAVAATSLVVALAWPPPGGAAPSAFVSPKRDLVCAHLTSPGRAGAPVTLLSCQVRATHLTADLFPSGPAQRQTLQNAYPTRSIPVLRVGRTWRRGAFACSMRPAAVRCVSRRSGHGFLLGPGRLRRVRG